MYPYALTCYLGILEVQFTCKSKGAAKRTLEQVLRIEQVGRFHSEGLGRVQWLNGRVEEKNRGKNRNSSQIRIRKGLPHYLPESVKELVRYALLHDFANTERHRSKIYVEVPLEDDHYMELLRRHHERETDNALIKAFQQYDQQAARLNRRIRAPTMDRYNWQAKESQIDFQKLAEGIKRAAKNIWKLYKYIHSNEELSKLNESLEYGHTTLKMHLLLITNLIVQDFLAGKLKNLNHGRDAVNNEQIAVDT